jgi:hypothetical protein
MNLSYHPLLNELILNETLKYLCPSELRKLRRTNSSWKNAIEFNGAMKHQWVHTHQQLKQIQNISTFKYPQRHRFCSYKGCYISYYCKDDRMIIEFSDITKTYHYRHKSEKISHLCEHTSALWNDYCVIPSVFCIDNVDHFILRIKFSDCHYCVDYSDLTNIIHYHCSLICYLPHSNEMGFHHVHLSLLYDSFSLDLSGMKFLKFTKFQKTVAIERRFFCFFQNCNHKTFFITEHIGEFKNISVFCESKLLCKKSLKICVNAIHVYGICEHFILVLTDGFAHIFDFQQDGNVYVSFEIHKSIRIRQVLTLSNNQFLILFQDPLADTISSFFINLTKKTITEIKHHEALKFLGYVVNVTQLNDEIFMFLGRNDNKFIQVIIDFHNKISKQNSDFNQLEEYAQKFKPSNH